MYIVTFSYGISSVSASNINIYFLKKKHSAFIGRESSTIEINKLFLVKHFFRKMDFSNPLFFTFLVLTFSSVNLLFEVVLNVNILIFSFSYMWYPFQMLLLIKGFLKWRVYITWLEFFRLMIWLFSQFAVLAKTSSNAVCFIFIFLSPLLNLFNWLVISILPDAPYA